RIRHCVDLTLEIPRERRHECYDSAQSKSPRVGHKTGSAAFEPSLVPHQRAGEDSEAKSDDLSRAFRQRRDCGLKEALPVCWKQGRTVKATVPPWRLNVRKTGAAQGTDLVVPP